MSLNRLQLWTSISWFLARQRCRQYAGFGTVELVGSSIRTCQTLWSKLYLVQSGWRALFQPRLKQWTLWLSSFQWLLLSILSCSSIDPFFVVNFFNNFWVVFPFLWLISSIISVMVVNAAPQDALVIQGRGRWQNINLLMFDSDDTRCLVWVHLFAASVSNPAMLQTLYFFENEKNSFPTTHQTVLILFAL